MHHLLYIFYQDVWDVLLHASRQGPEDCCVWLWLTEQRWKSGWDGHRFGEQTPVSFQALLWPASDLLCVSMCCYSTASAVQWMYQTSAREFFDLFLFLEDKAITSIILLQFRDQSVERPAEAVADPAERGQSERRPSSTHRGRWKLTLFLRKRIPPARFRYCHCQIP